MSQSLFLSVSIVHCLGHCHCLSHCYCQFPSFIVPFIVNVSFHHSMSQSLLLSLTISQSIGRSVFSLLHLFFLHHCPCPMTRKVEWLLHICPCPTVRDFKPESEDFHFADARTQTGLDSRLSLSCSSIWYSNRQYNRFLIQTILRILFDCPLARNFGLDKW